MYDSRMLIIFGGLPGTGKTVIARELAKQIGATYLRIDSIEQAIRTWASAGTAMDDAGYRVAYALAEDNLRIGRIVVADSVNPIRITRDAWLRVAERCQAQSLEIEVICSDVREHQRRIEERQTDIAGLVLPTWQDVLSREYEPWEGKRVIIDTAKRTIEENVAAIRQMLP